VLVKGGTVVRASGARLADVLVRDGRIVEVGPGVHADGETVIDATGMLVLPGVVDPHTHFELDTGSERTLDDFASASIAAAAGGVTTFLDFAPQQHGQTFSAALETRLAQIEGRSLIDYGIHLNISRPDHRLGAGPRPAGRGWRHQREGLHDLSRHHLLRRRLDLVPADAAIGQGRPAGAGARRERRHRRRQNPRVDRRRATPPSPITPWPAPPSLRRRRWREASSSAGRRTARCISSTSPPHSRSTW